MSNSVVYCSNCGATLVSADLGCPICNSSNRFIGMFDSVDVDDDRAHFRELLDKMSYNGKHKYSYEVTIKPDFDIDTQQNVIVTRKFNRRNNLLLSEKTYTEEIYTRDGKLIKSNTDILVNHQEHGSAKKKGNPLGGDSHA